MARGFFIKLNKIVTPQVDGDSETVDTYCIFSKWLMISGFIFQIVSVVEYLQQLVKYAIYMHYHLNKDAYDQETLKANAIVLLKVKYWWQLLWPYTLCQFVMIICIFSEWIAMWFLVYVHKDYDPDELLFDHENPAILSAPGDDAIFAQQRNNTD